MFFLSHKSEKILALAMSSYSLLACSKQVSCVKNRWEVDGISYCYDNEKRYLYIDVIGEGGEIKKDDFKDFVMHDVESISMGEGVANEGVRLLATKTLMKERNVKGQKKKGLCKNLAEYLFRLIPVSEFKIGEGVFQNFRALKSVKIFEGVTEIAKSAFDCCSSLEKVQLPDSLRKVGDSAFSYCSNLKNIRIPKNVIEIGEYAFERCSSLQKVQLSDSLLKIDDLAFTGCSDLKSIRIPKNVTEIGEYTFEHCSALQEVQFPDSLLKIGDLAFTGCSALKSIRIPKNVTEIGEGAFKYCSYLDTAYVPSNAKIGEDAFPDTTKVIRY